MSYPFQTGVYRRPHDFRAPRTDVLPLFAEVGTDSIKHGSFNITTGTADVVVTGVGFQPTAILFYYSGQVGSADALQDTGSKEGPGMGWAVSPTSRAAWGTWNNEANPVLTFQWHTATACIAASHRGTDDGLADLKTMDADGFTLAIDTAFGTNKRIHYVAFGGAVTNAASGTAISPGLATTQEISGLGFQPDVVLFFGFLDPTQNTTTGTFGISFGVATGAASAENWVAALYSAALGAGTNSRCTRYGISGECVVALDRNTIHSRAILDSMNVGGFTLDWLEDDATDRRWYWLALKGGNWKAGNFLTKTDGTDIAVTGVGFTPEALVFGSVSAAERPVDSPLATLKWTVGAATSPTQRSSVAAYGQNAVNPSNTSVAQEFDEFYANIAGSIAGLGDLKTFDPDGFTAVMDDPDPVASFVGYLAFVGVIPVTDNTQRIFFWPHRGLYTLFPYPTGSGFDDEGKRQMLGLYPHLAIPAAGPIPGSLLTLGVGR